MNNQKTSSTKSYIIIGVIIIIAVAAYFYWNGSGVVGSATLGHTDMQDEVVGARVMVLLNQISSLKIDTALFKSPTYTTLQDYTIKVPELPVGRPNPFAPIPGMPVTTGTSGTGH